MSPGKIAASPRRLGIDISAWASALDLVGVEQLRGSTVYHVKLVVDGKQVGIDIAQLGDNPRFKRALQATHLAPLKRISAAPARQLEAMIKSGSAELWIDTTTFMPRKMIFAGELSFSGGADILRGHMTMLYGTINQPVTVESPTSTKYRSVFQAAYVGL